VSDTNETSITDRALAMRMIGASYEQVGEALGIDPKEAFRRVSEALGAAEEDNLKRFEAAKGRLLSAWLIQIDASLEFAYARVKEKSPSEATYKLILYALEQKAKLLGLGNLLGDR